MAKTIDVIKEWAKENVQLTSLLPPTTNGPVTNRLSDILEKEVDEKFYLSQEKVDSLLFKLNEKKEGEINVIGNLQGNFRSVNEVLSQEGISTCLNTMTGGGREPKIAIPVLTPDRANKRQNGRRFKTDGEPMFTLTSQDRHGIMVKEATKQGYAIAAEGDSINLQYPESKTRRGRVGNQIANTIQATGDSNQGVVIENPLKGKTDYGWHFEQNVYGENGLTRTVKAGGGSGNIPKVITGYRIRKLTPLECWRLQSFPDSAFEKAQAVNSNSQLYKQAGNSVTVNVIKAIAIKF